jgi:uncharacterized protein
MSGPPLWVVERPGSRVFLFGEAVGLRDASWLSDEIRAAVEASRELWREADRSELSASPLLLQYGLADKPLSVRVEGGRIRRLRSVAAAVGVDPASLEGLRPWAAGQLLDQAMRASAGYDDACGVDAVITALATATGLPVRYEMDDAEATFSWFDGLDPDLEVDYLMLTLDRVAAGPAQVDRHVEAWQRGDLSVAESEDRTMRERYPALHERMLVDRNRRWVPRIEAMLTEPGTAFVLVGGLHLVGDTSIQACLAPGGLQPRRLGPRGSG